MSTVNSRKSAPTWRLAIPALLFVLVFLAIPIGIAAVYSFLTADPYGGASRPFTLAAYIRFLYDRDLDDKLVFDTTYIEIFVRSFGLAGLTTMLCAVIGLPFAWFIATRHRRQRQILVLLVTIPFWTNLMIRIYCWVLLLRDNGVVNALLLWLHVTRAPIGFLYSDGAILMGLVYSNLPFMTLPILAALDRLDQRLVEAAYDLYARRRDVMRHLVLPLARPGIAAGAVLVFVPSLGAFLAPDLLGGGKKLMIGALVQQQFSTARDWPFGSALAMILTTVVLVAMTFGAWRRAARDLPA